MVKRSSAHVHLQVSNHVEQNKTHHGDTTDCHDVLFAHCCGVQIEEERTFASGTDGGCRDWLPLGTQC